MAVSTRWVFQRGVAIATLFLVLFKAQAQGLPVPPKRELRAAWVAHVFNLDWPTAPHAHPGPAAAGVHQHS